MRTWRSSVPGTVWALGFVSLLMDVSSEMIHSLLPVFLIGTLAASASTLGLIEGTAEATANIVKVFSGTLSDRWRRRKSLTLLGYGMAAFTKPLFPLASGVTAVFIARFIDRIGKGIRGAPRDAMIADATPAAQRGAAFGLRQSMDTVGAVAGPLLAILFATLYAGNVRRVFWIAVIPACLCVAVLWLVVKEPPRADTADNGRAPPIRLGALPRGFWILTLAAGVFSLARFSEAFLVLRARDVGMATALTPLALVAMNITYAACAYPAGLLADHWPRARVLMLGCAVLAGANLLLALGSTTISLLLGAAVWGVHMGLTEGIFAALVADTAPPDRRGSAFGVFNLIRGVLLFAASAGAGLLWDRMGAAATFGAGAALAVASLLMLRMTRRAWEPRSESPRSAG